VAKQALLNGTVKGAWAEQGALGCGNAINRMANNFLRALKTFCAKS